MVFRTGSGSSQLENSTAAGRAAAGQAVDALGGLAPALVIVYASTRFDLPEVLAGVRAVTGDAPLVGASCSGAFLDGEMFGAGRGVAVLVLSAGRYQFATASESGLHDDPYGVGRRLTRAAMAAAGAGRPRYAALLLIADGHVGGLQSLLNGVYQVAGAAVPLIGGGASTYAKDGTTYVFHDDRLISDGAVAVWIGSDRPLRVAVGHGWRPYGLPLLVTRAEGRVVHEIAGRPGLEVYQDRLADDEDDGDDGGDVGETTGAGNEWWRGGSSTRALGLIEPDGRELIRNAYVDDDRTVRTYTPLPPYSAVRIMTSSPEDLLSAGELVVAEALGATWPPKPSTSDDVPAAPGGGVVDPQVLLVFSCAVRMEILQRRAGEEPARLQKAAESVRTFGFYTFGEFARSTGAPGYHNATIAALAL